MNLLPSFLPKKRISVIGVEYCIVCSFLRVFGSCVFVCGNVTNSIANKNLYFLEVCLNSKGLIFMVNW